ncbi:erythromycin esterase family protein [Amycolatopsis cihanbeyliensis]|uniref:Erythromycin esterase n=1 Tax=Amycolatopsis cihanbeyliensis TaxID=1128664 RepID=A0A542DPJ1_AMYCI|nr:erythromycin esterase family protein [Amycolatopsis cihanbeyliensis]TQJ04885.1 erythromycin esterase [Amycolatopsis cihanbeyliensis]
MNWIAAHAHPLRTLDPEASLTDLLPLGELVGDATIVALGTASRLTTELSAVAQRILRVLVEWHGFRTLALEGDEQASVELDRYVRTGDGDLTDLLSGARSFWRTEEIRAAVRWVREFNQAHPEDPVRIAHPERPADPAAPLGSMPEIERGLAENTLAWQRRTGDKIVYWGGIAHTLTRDSPPVERVNMGTRLRAEYGCRYVSIGLTFHHGTGAQPVPPPPPDHAEAALGAAGIDAYYLDLRADPDSPARAWLDAPTRARLIGPRYDPELYLDGGSLAEWFDVLVYLTATTPFHPLPS